MAGAIVLSCVHPGCRAEWNDINAPTWGHAYANAGRSGWAHVDEDEDGEAYCPFHAPKPAAPAVPTNELVSLPSGWHIQTAPIVSVRERQLLGKLVIAVRVYLRDTPIVIGPTDNEGYRGLFDALEALDEYRDTCPPEVTIP